jgi:hypothetical protein
MLINKSLKYLESEEYFGKFLNNLIYIAAAKSKFFFAYTSSRLQH